MGVIGGFLVIRWLGVGRLTIRLGIDGVVVVDVAVAWKLHPPVAFGVVAVTGFVVAVIQGLLVVIFPFDCPVELVVSRSLKQVLIPLTNPYYIT